jgi:shikimate kinase
VIVQELAPLTSYTLKIWRIMTPSPSNLVLIGMPGAGKSTVGVILAKKIARNFVDTDLLIQMSRGRTLQEIVETDRYSALRTIEEEILLGLTIRNCVIATGGSAVYSERAMAHLMSDGIIIFLDVELATLERRVSDYSTRGLAKRPDQSFADLFVERRSLYKKYANISITCDELTLEQVCDRITESLSEVGRQVLKSTLL